MSDTNSLEQQETDYLQRPNIKCSGDILRMDTNPTVPKALGAIQIKEINGSLNATDRKAIDWLLHNAHEEVGEEKVHEARLSDLRKYVSPKHKSNERVVETTKKLGEVTLQFDFLDTEGFRKWGSGSFMVISADEKEDLLRYTYPHWLRPLLADPAVWARLSLRIIQQFSSKYSIALYENLESYANRHNPKWPVSVDDLRILLGVPENKLVSFGSLAQKAIDPALKEINQYADFQASYRVIKKKGRKILELEFIIEKKDGRKALEELTKGGRDKDTADIVHSFSLSEDTYQEARRIAPGADIYLIEQEWREWAKNKSQTTRLSGDTLFLKFCKKWYENRFTAQQGNLLF